MSFDADVALHFFDPTVAARDKCDAEIAKLPALRGAIDAIRSAAHESGLADLMRPYFQDEQMHAASGQKQLAEQTQDAFDAALLVAVAAIDLDTLLELLVTFAELRVPPLLVRAFTSNAFVRLNGLSPAERRRVIGMDGDTFGQDIIEAIVNARTQWAVPQASGVLYEQQLDESAAFAWPTDTN